MTTIPNRIQFINDDNVIQLEEVIDRENRKKLPEPKYAYRYIISQTKFGLLLILTEPQIESLIKNKIAKIIEC